MDDLAPGNSTMPPSRRGRLEGGRRVRGEVRTEPPLVSIVVVLFRDREECIRLLNNIFTFDPRKFELIVVDGGSDDGTVEVLREWDDKIGYWLSEPDSGIYDAMNKGIAAAEGEYILHLNAGDTLKSIPSETLAACLKDQVDVASFAVMTDDGEIFHPKMGFQLRVVNSWHHQGTFYRRTPDIAYDTSYKIFADFDLNQRLCMSGKRVRIFEEIVSVHGTGGISHSGSGRTENYRTIQKNFGPFYVVIGYLWPHYQALRRGTKRVLVFMLSLVGKQWK
jgi:glycosyltransferase involved in cell wall biosynthesis